jgi:hypothetical protein
MSRLAHLVRHPRRTLAALGTVLTAVGVTVASGADFTAASANPANTFSAGSLAISNDKENQAILTAANLRPGGAASVGTADIANTGSLSGTFSLARSTPVDSDTANPLSGKLNLVVDDCGAWAANTPPDCSNPSTKYSGTLAAMSTTDLGSFGGGDKHRYRFRVSLDGSAGNAYQGDSSTVAFNWNAA